MHINFSDENCIPDSTFLRKVIYVRPRVPNGITVRRCDRLSTVVQKQYGIFATRKFKKGDILYTTNAHVITMYPQQPLYFKFEIPEVGLIPISFHEHMVSVHMQGAYFGFACIMNHSCEPNSLSVDTDQSYKVVEITPFRWSYQQLALQDIEVDEEITCNYLLFCEGGSEDGAGGFVCKCGNRNCYGRIDGFKSLPLEKQRDLLPLLHIYFKEKWGCNNY